MTETNLFERWREILMKRYGHDDLDHTSAIQAHGNLIEAYNKFRASGCADPHFVQEICSPNLNKSAQRLGEMLLYERLSHVRPCINICSQSNGPDFQIDVAGKSVWLELITPSIGVDTKISDLKNTYDPLRPCADATTELRKRHLLRVTSAISEKLKSFERYIEKKVVAPDEPLIIVINDSLLTPEFPMYGVTTAPIEGVSGASLVEEAVYGVGPLQWVKSDSKDKSDLQTTYREEVANRPEAGKGGAQRGRVPVNIFSNQMSEKIQPNRATIISAIMQLTLREDYGIHMDLRNQAETTNRPLDPVLEYRCVMAFNPVATNKIDASVQQALMQTYNLNTNV